MDCKIKLLLSVGSLGIGGNEIFTMNLFRNIDKTTFEIDFIVFDSENMFFYNEIISSNSKVYICSSKYKNKYIACIDQFKQVKRLLKQSDYDIIHCNSCSFLGILHSALPARLNGSICIISHAHNVGEPTQTKFDIFMRNLLKKLLSNIVDFGFACSDSAGGSKYTDKFIKSCKYKVINNAVDIEKYVYDDKINKSLRKELKIPEDAVILGNIGRLDYQKNHEYLIDIFDSYYRNKNTNAYLFIIGEGILKEKLENKVRRLKLDDRVIFAGQKGDANKYYNIMNCFLLPSLFEGFPFVLIEAQINGLHCLASSEVTPKVDVSNTIRFIPLYNTEAWVQAIEESVGSRINNFSIQKVICKYDIKEETKTVEGVYKYLFSTKEQNRNH